MTTFVRLFARPMLAAIFVAQGVRVLKDPDSVVPAAKPVTDRVMPTVKRCAPDQVAERIPDNARTLVRINAAVHVAGGLALATGKYRRVGALALAASLVPTTVAGHAFWEEGDDAEQRSAQRTHFLKNLGLTGGLLLAAFDTEGKPGLVWRARHAGKTSAKQAARVSKRANLTARREIRAAKSAARREAKSASAKAGKAKAKVA